MALSVSRLVRVTVNLSPIAAARRSFGILMIAGDSNVINVDERFRSYDTLEGVALDFGVTAPEYYAAALYFGQSPKPQNLMIGRWARTATAGLNIGGILSASQQLLSNWTAITNGGFKITVDSVLKTLGSLDFSGASNLNGVAAIIDAALSGASCTWDGEKFTVTSDTTGAASTVSAAISPASGTDISAQLKLTAATNIALVDGIVAESPVA